MTFEIDRPTLWELLDASVKAALDEGAFAGLPAFIRDWNEGTGWAARGLDEAAPNLPASLGELAGVPASAGHDVRAVPGTAHFPMLERPEELYATLRDVLRIEATEAAHPGADLRGRRGRTGHR